VVYTRDPRSLNPALIINPKAKKNERRWPHLAALARQAGWPFRLGVEPEELCQIAAELVAQGSRLLLICGGDGTLAAILTFWLDLPAENRPFLTPLLGGTTNLIVRDLTSTPPEKLLKALFKGCLPRIKRRTVMRLNPPGACGMFLGGGLVAEGVSRFRERRHKGEGAPWKALGFVPAKLWSQETQRPIEFLESSNLLKRGPFWFFFLTTLKRLFGWFDPLKECSSEKLRGLALKKGVNFSALFLKYWIGKRLEVPHVHHVCEKQLLVYAQELALDGEIYYSPSKRFLVEVAGEVEFLIW